MAATDGQIILAASRFGDTSVAYLRDFAKTELPAVAKIVKGQHHTLGVPSLSNPSLQSTALFLNAGRKYQILAQPIKIKEGRKSTNVGPKVLIPETYHGYFELLSEDGRSTRCIESVLELSKRKNLRVLVRESLRCNHNSKTLHAGEILTTISDNGKYLQCKTQKDGIVNLPLEAKAKFSPIAKEDSISGVHTVKNLLQKRMPVIVRLVHGTAPKGLKTPFVPELRLLGCIEIDRVFALPLQKESDLVPVPLNVKIKLQRAKNMEQLENFIEYSRFMERAQRLLVDARDRLQIIDLKLTEKSDKKDSSKNSNNSSSCSKKIASLSGLTTNGYLLRKSASCDSKYLSQISNTTLSCSSSHQHTPCTPDEYDEIDQIYDYVRGFAPLPKSLNKFEAIIEPSQHTQHHQQQQPHSITTVGHMSHSKFNESIRSSNCGNYTNLNKINNNNNSIINHVMTSDSCKPIPPPIETIPGKKLPEKRQRPTLPKLYVKNNIVLHPKPIPQSQHNGCGTSPVNLHNGTKDSCIEPQSPLFHIRYKSLSSLQLTPDSNPTTPISPSPKSQDTNHKLCKSASTGKEGTLDSSRSGGRTSGDSKLPEKKTRRLSRPRSLSNLVWDFKPQKEKTKKKLYVHHFDRQQGTLYL